MSKTASQPDDGDYLRRLRLSGLVANERLARALQDFEQQTKPLPQFLVDSNVLTPWQNAKLLEGKHKGFFLGEYKVLGHIGTGGMSSVYLAEHTRQRRRVALRVLNQAAAEHANYLTTLYSEMQKCASLDHPNIVRVFDVDNEGVIHYIVMEYVEGQDLATFVGKVGSLPQANAAEYVRQAADGLAYAHERGLIHRDIRPSALLLDRSGSIRILDLGTRPTSESLWSCAPGRAPDQMACVAPEIALDQPVDARADVYSLGCTLYFLLMGRAPFSRGADDPVTRRIYADWLEEKGEYEEANRQRNWSPAEAWVRPIAFFRTDVSSDLIKICESMMAMKPAERYQTCGEVRDALANWLANHAGG